jgi:hypothetical protein
LGCWTERGVRHVAGGVTRSHAAHLGEASSRTTHTRRQAVVTWWLRSKCSS